MIPFSDLVYEGTTIDNEFVRGQLFRFGSRFYICTNIPHSLEEMNVLGQKPQRSDVGMKCSRIRCVNVMI